MSLKYKTPKTVYKYSFVNIKTVWMRLLQPGICVNANYIGRLINSFKMVWEKMKAIRRCMIHCATEGLNVC